MPRWDAWLSGPADVLGPLLLTVPPRLGSRRPPPGPGSRSTTLDPWRWPRPLGAYANRVIDCYDEVVLNFKASILHCDVVGPYQLEHEYGLIGGNIFHGGLSLKQLSHMRPAPGFADCRTPIHGLYYASSATHGGGGASDRREHVRHHISGCRLSRIFGKR